MDTGVLLLVVLGIVLIVGISKGAKGSPSSKSSSSSRSKSEAPDGMSKLLDEARSADPNYEKKYK